MKMTRIDAATHEGTCDRCGRKVQRHVGESDIQCSCGAIYNAFGQRLRDDLYTRPNPSSLDEDIDDLTGDELSRLRLEHE